MYILFKFIKRTTIIHDEIFFRKDTFDDSRFRLLYIIKMAMIVLHFYIKIKYERVNYS